MQMVNIGCGIKLKCHTLRALLISFFHWMMAESQVRTAEKADLGGCGSVSSQALFGHGDEKDAGNKLSLEEEPGVALSTNISSQFRMQNEGTFSQPQGTQGVRKASQIGNV